jgi:hypothetical protein
MRKNTLFTPLTQGINSRIFCLGLTPLIIALITGCGDHAKSAEPEPKPIVERASITVHDKVYRPVGKHDQYVLDKAATLEAKVDRLQASLDYLVKERAYTKQAALVYRTCSDRCAEAYEAQPKVQHYDETGVKTYESVGPEHQSINDKCYKACERVKPPEMGGTC